MSVDSVRPGREFVAEYIDCPDCIVTETEEEIKVGLCEQHHGRT